MEADIPTVKSFIDRILELRQQQADLRKQTLAVSKQVAEVFREAQDAGIERPALLMAVNAIKKRADAERLSQLDELDATATMANAYLGEFYGDAKAN